MGPDDDQNTEATAGNQDGATDAVAAGDGDTPETTLHAVEAALKGVGDRGDGTEADAPSDTIDQTSDDGGGGEQAAAADSDGDKGKAGGEDEVATDPDLEPPEGLSDSARERFEKLVSGYKDKSHELEQLTDGYQQLVTVIQDTGANSEEFGTALEYMRFAHSDNPADLERALELVEKERNAIAVRLGKTLPGAPDPLDSHPDLKERVENMDITEDIGREMAQMRNQQQRNRESAEQTAARRDQEAAAARSQSVVQALNQLETRWKASDLDYARKGPLIAEYITNNIAFFKDNPAQIIPAVQREYERLGKIMQAAQPARPRPRRGAQPLAGSATPGNQRPAPKSTMDAITAVIGHGIDG